jgi:hypothetical protein
VASTRELDERQAALVLVQRLAEHGPELQAWLGRFRAALAGDTADVADLLPELARLLGLRILVLDSRGEGL